jgi:hypothetical protein
MRGAKQVKVIHRWKAEDNGEIPIGGDEMLGTAMNMASHMNGISEAVETAMPVVKNAIWLNAHIAAPFLATNAGFKVGSDNFDSWKIEGGKVAYGLGSVIGHIIANGAYGNTGELLRGATVATGSALLSLHSARKTTLSPMKLIRNAAIGCYTVATVSYAVTKYKNR